MRTPCMVALLLVFGTAAAAELNVEASPGIEGLLQKHAKEEQVECCPVPYVYLEAPRFVGEPIKWVANNTVRWQGWSLTGYCWGHMAVEKYTPRKLSIFDDSGTARVNMSTVPSSYTTYRCWSKVGLISGDIEALKKSDYDQERVWREFSKYDSQVDRDPVFGFIFVAEF
jgi:hypothetical protein